MTHPINALFDPAEVINIPIQPNESGQPRYPFVFLIDTSPSTSFSPPGSEKPDIVSLNEMLGQIYARLHSGRPGDELEVQRPNIDVSLLTYGSDVKIVTPWTRADTISPSPPPLSAETSGSTVMGHALSYAIGYTRKLQDHYRKTSIPKGGVPIIFHVTDGGAKDIAPHTESFKMLRESIDRLNPGGEAPTRLVIYHFVTPNGYLRQNEDRVEDENGQPITGEELLKRMFGSHQVMALQQGADSFQTLVKFITRTISHVSQGKTPTAEMLDQLMAHFKANPADPA